MFNNKTEYCDCLNGIGNNLRTFIYLLEGNNMLIIYIGMKGLKTFQNVGIGMTETTFLYNFFLSGITK